MWECPLLTKKYCMLEYYPGDLSTPLNTTWLNPQRMGVGANFPDFEYGGVLGGFPMSEVFHPSVPYSHRQNQ